MKHQRALIGERLGLHEFALEFISEGRKARDNELT
jgi:hypothetical protein